MTSAPRGNLSDDSNPPDGVPDSVNNKNFAQQWKTDQAPGLVKGVKA